MTYRYYYHALWKMREMNNFDEQIQYLTEVIERENQILNNDMFENIVETDDGSPLDYNKFVEAWNRDLERPFYINKLLEERHKKIEQKYGERNIKHSIQWKAGSEKLADFIIALKEQNLIQIVDRVDFMNSLLYGIHPEHKAVWLIALNALDDLIQQLNDSKKIIMNDGKIETIRNYFLNQEKKDISSQYYKNQQKREVLPENIDKLDQVLSVIK